MHQRITRAFAGLATFLIAFGGPAPARASEPAAAKRTFPQAAPGSPADAVRLLGSAPAGSRCDLPSLPILRRPSTAELRRAFALARAGAEGDGPATSVAPGVDLRWPVRTAAELREDGGIEAPLVDAVADGVRRAHALLVEGLQLRAPALELTLSELGQGLDGYVLAPADGEPVRAVLSSSPCAGLDGARAAAIHAYAQAVALAASSEFPASWAAGLATWTRLAIAGELDEATAALFSERLARLAGSLETEDRRLGAGNALWLAFVELRHGPIAVRSTVDELARGQTPREALDRALRRVSADDLEAAFRDFHVGALLAGPGGDPREFPWADRLRAPLAASVAEGLPALSVLADAALAPLGAAHVRLRPGREDGGLAVRFETELPAHWRADLVLRGGDGRLRRLALEVSPEGRGLAMVPLAGLDEAWLLLRNHDAAPARYTYAIHRERGFPFELASLEARRVPGQGVLVSWDTASEQHLLGFNLLRVREDGGQSVTVNPVWVPALGTAGSGTSYHFLDSAADPGESYLYRVEGITLEGLPSLSDPVLVPVPLVIR